MAGLLAPGPAAARDPSLFQEALRTRKFVPLNRFAGETGLLSQGKVRLVFVWASWCPTCLQAATNLNRELDSWYDLNVRVYGISVDEKLELAQKSLKVNGTRIPTWYAGADMLKLLKMQIYPTFFVLDANNRIRSVYAGYSGEKGISLRKRLHRLLAE